MELGGLLWTSVLKLALPPHRQSPEASLEHQEPFIHMAQNKREKTQINRIRNEKGEVTTDTAEIQKIMRDYYKQLYAKIGRASCRERV